MGTDQKGQRAAGPEPLSFSFWSDLTVLVGNKYKKMKKMKKKLQRHAKGQQRETKHNKETQNDHKLMHYSSKDKQSNYKDT